MIIVHMEGLAMKRLRSLLYILGTMLFIYSVLNAQVKKPKQISPDEWVKNLREGSKTEDSDKDLGLTLEPADKPRPDERNASERVVVLSHLGADVRVLLMHDPSTPGGRYRKIGYLPSGEVYDWEQLSIADRTIGAKRENERIAKAVAQLPQNFHGNVIVWRRNSLPTVERNAPKARILQLLDDPQVGRLVLPDEKEISFSELDGSHLCQSCTGGFGLFNMVPLVEATSYGEGARVGIHENKIYNQDENYDSRIKNPVASLELGSSGWGSFFGSFHANKVASTMWAKQMKTGYIKNSDPVALGVGDGNASPASLFEIYSKALPFLLANDAYVVNYSSYYSSDWYECNTSQVSDYELLQDYYQYKHRMLIVQAVGNLCESDNMCLRLTNALTVGGSNPDLSQTHNIECFAETMEIPHVVGNCYGTGDSCDDLGNPGFSVLIPNQPGTHMCAGGNSFNAPATTGIAAMIRQKADLDDEEEALHPEVLRAIIMAAASYEVFEGDVGGQGYTGLDSSPYCSGCTIGEHEPDIDCYYGAGLINGGRAWDIYQRREFEYYFSNEPNWITTIGPFTSDEPDSYIKAAVAWSNTIDCDDIDCFNDDHISHDFDLILEQRKSGAWEPRYKAHSGGGTAEWLKIRLNDYVEQSEDNYFRLVVLQSTRRIERPVHIGFAMYLNGCTEVVTIPSNDPTPPLVRLTITHDDEELILTSENDDVTRHVTLDDVVSFEAEAFDRDGGIRYIGILGSMRGTCRGNRFSQNLNSTITIDEIDDKQPGETTIAKKTLSHVISMEDYESMCQQGYSLTHVSITLSAKASNFSDKSNQTVSITLTLR